MVTSLNWLKEYVPGLDTEPHAFCDAMTLSGSKVEGFTKLDENTDKIIIGKILSVNPHPNADKLVVCQVEIGKDGEAVQIVTGAPNVFPGAYVPVVLAGGKVAGDHDGHLTPGGVEIKKGALRGVESNGMMCSIEELGSSRNYFPEAAEYGIYIFGKEGDEECSASSTGKLPEIGDNAMKYLGLDDVVVEYEITSNRVDCFSVLGLAREAAATFGKEFKPPVVEAKGNSEDASDYIKVMIEDPELCPRYTARVVKNVKIGPSPAWMRHHLMAHGIRPINNLVDITNYVMEEFGQPMHAYDISTIEGGEIHVRCARDGEKFTTLDGQEHELDSRIVMICDKEKPVGIGGIMGGENSMITDKVQTVLFEAANFDGTNIRLSSKRLGMRTDASAKFEKGLDPNIAMLANDRACQLMEMLGAGEVVGGAVDVYPKKRSPWTVTFCPERINKLLGTDIDEKTMIGYLEKIDLKVDTDKMVVEIPTWRPDLLREADIAEEVARFYGYDKIPTTLPGGSMIGGLSYKLKVENEVSRVCTAAGFSQAMTYSFESPGVFDTLMIPKDSKLRETVTIRNPLGPEFSIMRTLPVNGMLTSLATNASRRNKNVRLFELATVYLPKALPLTELPDERVKLTLGMFGEGDFFTLKGVVEQIFACCGMNDVPEYDGKAEIPFLHPGRRAEIIYGGDKIGYMGEVHPTVASAYGMKVRAYIAVLDMPTITKLSDFDRKYKGIAKFPSVTRDLSMVVPKNVPAGEIEKIFRQRARKILESVELFDIYEGEQVEEGCKSIAYKLTFRSSEKTLDENDITSTMKKILNGLDRMGIKLRQ